MIETLHQRAEKAIGQGYLTNSKRPTSHVKGIYPTHIKYGSGAKLIDHKDREYIDYICGLGVNHLGYGNPIVTEAVYKAIKGGVSHSFATGIEVEAAELLKETFFWLERVKFFKSGSDACTGAVKMARSYTGREIILTEGYHGWHADFISVEPPAKGVTQQMSVKMPIAKMIESVSTDIAACIVEPVITDYSENRQRELNALKEACEKKGVILIFDEVITGLRFPKLSVSAYFGIRPDLICLGKALGNGFPIAVVGGRSDILDNDYFISGTYFGEIASLAALIAVLKTVKTSHDYSIDTLWKYGQRFIDIFNTNGLVNLKGYPTRGIFEGEALTKALFFQEACKAGILFGPSWFYNFALIPHAEMVLNILKDIFQKIKLGEAKLEGELPQSPFAEKARK